MSRCQDHIHRLVTDPKTKQEKRLVPHAFGTNRFSSLVLGSVTSRWMWCWHRDMKCCKAWLNCSRMFALSWAEDAGHPWPALTSSYKTLGRRPSLQSPHVGWLGHSDVCDYAGKFFSKESLPIANWFKSGYFSQHISLRKCFTSSECTRPSFSFSATSFSVANWCKRCTNMKKW